MDYFLNIKEENSSQEPLRLSILKSLDISREFKLESKEMYKNNNSHTTAFTDNGEDGVTFKVSTIIKDPAVIKTLDNWYINKKVLNIVFEPSIDLTLLNNQTRWIMFEAKSRKQTTYDYTKWDITFRTYNPPAKVTFQKNKLQNRTTATYKLEHQCKSLKNLKYGKKNDCVKYMNQILVSSKCLSKVTKTTTKKNKKGKKVKVKKKVVSNEYNKKTVKALKKFAGKWNKKKLKPSLKKNGKVNKNMFKALLRYKELK